MKIRSKFVRIAFLLASIAYSLASAQTFPKQAISFSDKAVSVDLTASAGVNGNRKYGELSLGSSFRLTESSILKASVFHRTSSNVKAVSGLDGALFFYKDLASTSKDNQFRIYAGPGLRLGSDSSSAGTIDAGLSIKIGGLKLSGGYKYLSYFSQRQDNQGVPLSKNESQYYLVLLNHSNF